jgi:Protein of unknown function (DUF3175)
MTERKHKNQKWSAEVTKHSDALDLEADIFESDDPAKIAHSLERPAERSNRRKSAPFRSAMSMLTFYIRAPRKIGASLHRANQIQGSHALNGGGWHGTAWVLRFEPTL